MRPTRTSMTQTESAGAVSRMRAVSIISWNSSPFSIVSSCDVRLPNALSNWIAVVPVMMPAHLFTMFCDSSNIPIVMSNVWVTNHTAT